MYSWLGLVATIYVVVALGFGGMILWEASKRDVNFSIIHLVVPLLWPLWGIWYIGALINEWRVKRARRSV